MGFSIELDEDTARRLLERAARLSVDPNVLGRDYVRAELGKASRTRASQEEMSRFQEAVRELELISQEAGAPSLPDEAVARASIYADHD